VESLTLVRLSSRQGYGIAIPFFPLVTWRPNLLELGSGGPMTLRSPLSTVTFTPRAGREI